MGTTYTATIPVRCLKQHHCVGCGGKYSYVFSRQIKGQGASAEKAEANAEAAATKAVENDVDFHPCPHCGMVQPDMFADAQGRRLYWAAGLGAAGIAVALILGAARAITITTSAWNALGVAALALAWAVAGLLYNPNRQRESNRQAGARKVQQGLLSLDEKPAPASAPTGEEFGGLSMFNLLGAILLGVTIIAAALPILLVQLNGWARNATCYPEVVGAGDTARFYFNEDITSVKGMWNGTANVSANLEGAPPTAGFQARGETKDSHWGDTISGKSVSNSTNKMWVDVTFPQGLDAAGRTARLDMTVHARYPFGGQGGFDDLNKSFRHATTAVLSPPAAGTTFYRAWWLGQLSGIGLMAAALGCFYGACRSLRGKSNKTLVAPLADAPPPQE